jgi:hypothetical protein
VNLARDLFLSALAPNSRRTYHSGQRSFLLFCARVRVTEPLPATPTDVCMWLTSLAARRLRFTTIDNYRWALHSLHTDLGLPSVLDTNPQVQRIIDGIKRVQGANALRPPRLPVSPSVIRAITPLLNRDDPDHRMLLAAMWVACTAMLRPGELGVESAKAPTRLLTLQSLSLSRSSPPSYSILIAESKTDQLRAGVRVRVAGRSATRALSHYLAKRAPTHTPNSPLFARADGSPLTHAFLVESTIALAKKANISFTDPQSGRQFSGVSFRKGGATALAEAGVPDRIIQELGRWKSFCYKRYIHASELSLLKVFADF